LFLYKDLSLKGKIMKRIAQGMFVLGLTLLLTRGVSAHVTLSPKDAVIGYSTLSVSVPTEKDIPTVEVRVVIPDGVDVHGVMPVAGWSHHETRQEVETKDSNSDDHHEGGRVTEIAWTGGQIKMGEFQQFPISVSYAGEPTTLTWKAYQKYADGTIVAWDGADEKKPAPKVTMVQTSKLDATATIVETMKKNGATQTPWLSVGAFVLSAAALLMSRKNK
jgi:uncharacterized protein YcnI